jgi:type VI secretion system secreted protein VgrG
MGLFDLRNLFSDISLTDSHRAVRLRLPIRAAPISQVLLVQRADINEALYEGITGYITCLSTHAIAREVLLGVPIEVQVVSDQGALRRFAGVVADVITGHDDGGLVTCQLVLRDAFALMAHRKRTRSFTNKSPLDIIRQVIDELRRSSPSLGAAFSLVTLIAGEQRYPQRAMTMQFKESDQAFLCRLMRRAGISWFVRAGPESSDIPRHELVLFDDNYQLPRYEQGELLCRHNQVVAQRDSIDHWMPLARLGSGSVLRASYDYTAAWVNTESRLGRLGLGPAGAEIVAALTDARIEVPHAGADWEHHQRLAELAMQRHEFKARCVHGSSAVRDLPFGACASVSGHPELDVLAPDQREYVFIRVEHHVRNNLPKELEERADALLAANRLHSGADDEAPGWYFPDHLPGRPEQPWSAGHPNEPDPERYRNFFIACQRGVPIVPAWDPAKHLPKVEPITAIVVGPEGAPVWCDEQARVKVRYLGIDPDDDTDITAWLRVNQAWAGAGFGTLFPLRVGMEVTVIFMDGDPDKPLIVGPAYNARKTPPHLSPADTPNLNPYQSGLASQEINGWLQNRLRFDDNTGQVNAQLSSGHASSQLNIGALHHDRVNGLGVPRGEGTEVTTQRMGANRAEQGLYMTAEPHLQGGGPQMARGILIGQLQGARALAQSAGELAGTHQAEGTDTARQAELLQRVEDWDIGTNVRPSDAPPPTAAQPIIALSAPAGLAMASADNATLSAGTNLDLVSQQHTQLSAGRSLRMRALDTLSAFAHKGLEIIAATGRVVMRANAGDIEIGASDDIQMFSHARIVGQGEAIIWRTKGASITLDENGITLAGKVFVNGLAPSFSFESGGAGGVELPALPCGDIQLDERCRVVLGDEPVAGRPYTAFSRIDGRVLGSGTTDAQGFTQPFVGIDLHTIRITVHTPIEADSDDSQGQNA